MELKWFMYFVIFIKANTVSSLVRDLHYFRCLLEDTFEPCIMFPETSTHNVTILSYKLINEYGNLSTEFHYAIRQQNLTLISKENLEKIPDAIFLLLPVNHLSSINKKYLLNLIIQRSRSFIVKHLVKAYLLGNEYENFYEKLQTVDLPTRSLTWIADVISSDSNGTKELINHPPLLFYSPPFYLLFNNTSEKLFYLSLWEKSKHISIEINKAYLRFWAYATLKNSFPGPLNNWNDLCLERWGTLLTASTSDELKLLNHSNIDNLQLLFSFSFSPIQVRTLFEEFSEQLLNSRLDYSTLSNLLIDLLPNQLLFFSKIIPYIEQLKVVPSIKSIPTSKQIFELLMFEKGIGDEEGYVDINNFSYVLSPLALSDSLKHPLSLSSLIKIQSYHFSKSQLFVLSSRSQVLDFNSKYIFECRDLIKVLPARDIIFNQTASHVLLHLLSEVTAVNYPQSFAVFNKLWTWLGSSSAFKKILANKDADVLLEYIPSRFITKFVDNILKSIGENINSHMKLPDSFVSSLLVSLIEANKNFSLLNAEESLAFLFNGITCNDISSMDPYDFAVFMSKFTEQRRISGKDFPKTLQQCCLKKFFVYIELKASLFQGILGESKLSLLNEAEIESIGGYIFSALPIKPVEKAKYSRRIIKSIGELSLSELLMAAPISRLQEFATVLVHNDFNAGKKIDFPLFDLGNLTLFLDEKYIQKINETYFRLLLESRFIDRRVCTNKSSRLAWFNFLKKCFGETSSWTYQTLITLSDLLIVVPGEEIDKIPSNSWKYAADVLISHYDDIIKYSSSLKFYEVCMLQLSSDEAQLFFNDLKHLVEVFADAAQLQLNTVTTFQELKKKKKSNDGIFTFINSAKSNIKISIPSIENVIITQNLEMKNGTGLNVTKSVDKGGIGYSTSDVVNESSYNPEFPNFYSTDSEYMAKEIITNECNHSDDCGNYFSKERTKHYLGSTTPTPVDDELYSTFNQNGTFIEINEMTFQTSELPILILNSTNKVNMPYSEAPSKFDNISEIYLNFTTSFDGIAYSNFSHSTTSYGNSKFPFHSDLGNSWHNFTSKDHSFKIMQNSKSGFQNELTTSATDFSSIIYHNNYSSDSGIDYNDSLSNLLSLTSLNNMSTTTDRSITHVTTPINFKELITDSNMTSKHISEMISTPISKTFNNKIQNEFEITKQHQLENLLKGNDAKTEFLKLNYSIFRSKQKKFSYPIIGNDKKERVKRSIGQISCEALKMVGKLSEIIVSEELIQTMSVEDINGCVDLFSEMDLSMNVKDLILSKLKLDHIFLYGKLVSSINGSVAKSINFSISAPWALETINLIERYSSDPDVKEYIIKSITVTRKLHYTLEMLVSFGSLICDLPISPQLIEPSEFLKASVILGRNLPCNYSCLQKISNIAVKEGAFEDPSKWNAKDVSDLGIIVAGLERAHWKKLLHSKRRPLRGISELAFECLSREYKEELELQYNMNLSKIYMKGPDQFDRSVHFDFFGNINDSCTVTSDFTSHSIQLSSFYLGFYLQIVLIVILITTCHF